MIITRIAGASLIGLGISCWPDPLFGKEVPENIFRDVHLQPHGDFLSWLSGDQRRMGWPTVMARNFFACFSYLLAWFRIL